MKGLLAIEWLKIKRYRTFWVLAFLFLTLLPLWNILISQGILKLGGGSDFNLMNITYSFPSVWDNIGYWTKFFSGLISIVIIILVTNEYQYRTNRQNVIDGWTRLQFFHAKWLVVICMSVTITLFVFLQGILFGLSNGSSISEAGGHTEKLFYVLVLTMNYFSFAMTLSFLLKRSGMSVIIFLLYTYIIEIIIGQMLNWKLDGKPGHYLPLQCSAELLNFPLTATISGMISKSAGPSEHMLVLASVVWIVIYYFIGRRQLLHNDW